MNKKINTKQAFEIWKEYSAFEQDHLSMQRLYQLSLTDGLKNAKEYEIEHLSLCPHCLDNWEVFCSVTEPLTAVDYEEEHTLISCGFLKAASTGFTEPVYIKSDCKKFMLGIFPEIDSPGNGMAVLETIDERKSYDGMEANIMDAKGQIVLKNIIKHGRAASKIEHLDTLNLSKWTIVLSDTSDKDENE